MKLTYLIGLCTTLAFLGCLPQRPLLEPEVTLPGSNLFIPKQLPEEMTPLSDLKVISRGGMAVLLMFELPVKIFPVQQKIPMVVDVANHWARREILSSVRLGLLPVFSNHRFLPDQKVTRGEMAQVLAGILEQKEILFRNSGTAMEHPADLPEDHLMYAEVRRVLEADLMELDASGRFYVEKEVTGIQAKGYLERIKRYLDSSGTTDKQRE